MKTVFTGRWYFAPNSIIIRDSWGPSAVTRQLCEFHSTFDLSLCLGLIYLAYISCHSHHPAVHPPSPPLLPPTWMTPTFPPSAAIVISLPSTGPLIRLGWHVPRLYLTRRKMKSWTNLWSLPLLMSLPSPTLSFSLTPPPPPLHLLLLGTPAVVHLFSDTESYLFHCLLGWILPLLPFALCPSFTSFCQALNLPPPSLFHPPSPNTTCSHRCLAPIYGFVSYLAERKGKTWKRRWDNMEKNHVAKYRTYSYRNRMRISKGGGWNIAFNKGQKELETEYAVAAVIGVSC